MESGIDTQLEDIQTDMNGKIKWQEWRIFLLLILLNLFGNWKTR
jgi:hypothetical protein